MMRAILGAHAGLFVAGMVSFVLMGAGQSLFGPALPAFGRAFGIGAGEAGLLISAQWIGAALGVAAMYRFGDAVTPRMALSAMAGGAGLIGLSVATGIGWWPTVAGAVVFGVGYGGSTVIYNRRFLQVFGERGPAMLSLMNAIFGVGAIGAPLAFVALGGDPGRAYLGLAALAAVMAVFARAPSPSAAPLAGQDRGRFAPSPALLTFGALSIGTEAALVGLGPTALVGLGLSENGAAGMLSGFFLAFLAARLGLVPFAARVAPFALLIAALAVSAALAAALAVTGAAWLFVPLGAAAGLYFPAFFLAGARRMGDDARVAPVIIAAGLVGGILAPLVLGAVMARAGAAALFPALAVALALVALVALALRRRLAAPAPETARPGLPLAPAQ